MADAFSVDIISRIERELDFQRRQANGFKEGVFQNEILFARYDQASKILKWVLDLLKNAPKE